MKKATLKCRWCRFMTRFVGALVAHARSQHKADYKPHVPTLHERIHLIRQASCSARSKYRYENGYGDGAKVDSHRRSIDPHYRRDHRTGEIG